MRINLTPECRDGALIVIKNGDALDINGEAFDFTTLPDGATIPSGEIPCEWIIGDVERINGEIVLTLLLPTPFHAEQWQAFPEPLEDVPDGAVDLPASTTVDIAEVRVEGGKNIVVTKHRWHQPDEVQTTFIAEVSAPESENVDA
ncbi:hypothetical protein [Mesorhizobium sp. ESP-6-2]|uniref:hypothetical protein n=1 Tax=Mesorhizobium sp. ESP-6-2 TaxID=2876625 RepID=UPI00398C4381